MRIAASLRGFLVVLVVLSMTTADAAGYDPDSYDRYQNDAGSGADAGDESAVATPAALGVEHRALAPPLDVDWYSLPASASAVCLLTEAQSWGSDTYVRVGSGASEETSAVMLAREGGATVLGGLAALSGSAPSLRAASVNTTPDPRAGSYYEFKATQVSVPAPAEGDALTGGDAGGTPGTAVPIGAGCVGGHLGASLLDAADTFAITIPAGEVLTYSLSTTEAGGTLRLLDASGTLAGPTIGSGESADFSTAQGGTYYLSANRAAIGDMGYLIGVILGPGPGCRPGC